MEGWEMTNGEISCLKSSIRQMLLKLDSKIPQ